VQTNVCNHLAHSLAKAERSYRSKDLEAALRGGDAAELVQDNYRIFRKAQKDAKEFFKECDVLPSLKDLQETCRNFLKKATFKLTTKTCGDL